MEALYVLSCIPLKARHFFDQDGTLQANCRPLFAPVYSMDAFRLREPVVADDAEYVQSFLTIRDPRI